MTTSLALYAYWALSLSVLGGWVLWAARQRTSPTLLNRSILAGVLVMAICPAFAPRWSEEPLMIVSGVAATMPTGDLTTVPMASVAYEPVVPLTTQLFGVISNNLPFLLLGLCGLWSVLYGMRLVSTLRVVRRATTLHQMFGLRVAVAEDAGPFAFRCGLLRHIILPTEMLADPQAMRMALRHEYQHHRQGDTFVVHLQDFIAFAFFWNPIVTRGIHKWREVQEWACDEALVAGKRVAIKPYARCLLQVAENALTTQRHPAGTSGMAMSRSAHQLRRRILTMQSYDKGMSKRLAGIAMGLAIGVLGTTAMATGQWIFDRKVSVLELRDVASSLAGSTGFPIEVNELIAAQINRYVGTPDGRAFIDASLERRQEYEEMLRLKFSEYDMPIELLAIPLMESGYANIPQSPPNKGAGMWQFIPQTARNFGMRVGGGVDERLDAAKATDGALRYLNSLYMRFQDWRLAVMAYNAGEGRVQRGINATGSRDPWTLVEAGWEGDKTYLAKVMAGVLILQSPDLRGE